MVYEFIGSDPSMAIADISVDGGIPVAMISQPESNTTAVHGQAGRDGTQLAFRLTRFVAVFGR